MRKYTIIAIALATCFAAPLVRSASVVPGTDNAGNEGAAQLDGTSKVFCSQAARGPVLRLPGIDGGVPLDSCSTVSLTEDDLLLAPGVQWTARDAKSGGVWSSMVWQYGRFVSVCFNCASSANVNTSPDGINWTLRSSGVAGLIGVAWGNGRFCAVSTSSSQSTSSVDGITWTASALPNANTWQSLTYGAPLGAPGNFVAVSTSGTGNRVMTSNDCKTWTPQTSAADVNWNKVAYYNGMFVAVGNGGSIATSSDGGVTWALRTSPTSLPLMGVAGGNGLWVAVADASSAATTAVVVTSPDAITWTLQNIPTGTDAIDWLGVDYGRGYYIAVGVNYTHGYSVAAHSQDGSTWTYSPNVTGSTTAWDSFFFNVKYGNGVWVASSATGSSAQRFWTSGKPVTNEMFASMAVGTTVAGANVGITKRTGTGTDTTTATSTSADSTDTATMSVTGVQTSPGAVVCTSGLTCAGKTDLTTSTVTASGTGTFYATSAIPVTMTAVGTYALPIAGTKTTTATDTGTTLGGVKVGPGVARSSDGTISVTPSGIGAEPSGAVASAVNGSTGNAAVFSSAHVVGNPPTTTGLYGGGPGFCFSSGGACLMSSPASSILDIVQDGSKVYGLRMQGNINVRGTGDNFFQVWSASTGYTIFESWYNLGLYLSAYNGSGTDYVYLAPHRSTVAIVKPAGLEMVGGKTITLDGATSGYVSYAVPATITSYTRTAPSSAAPGANYYECSTGANATMQWCAPPATGITGSGTAGNLMKWSSSTAATNAIADTDYLTPNAVSGTGNSVTVNGGKVTSLSSVAYCTASGTNCPAFCTSGGTNCPSPGTIGAVSTAEYRPKYRYTGMATSNVSAAIADGYVELVRIPYSITTSSGDVLNYRVEVNGSCTLTGNWVVANVAVNLDSSPADGGQGGSTVYANGAAFSVAVGGSLSPSAGSHTIVVYLKVGNYSGTAATCSVAGATRTSSLENATLYVEHVTNG